MARATLRIWRGDAKGGAFKDYTTEVGEGMVVLDAVHQVQAESAPAVFAAAGRWSGRGSSAGRSARVGRRRR